MVCIVTTSSSTSQGKPQDLDCEEVNAGRHSCETQPQEMASVCKFRHMAMHAQPPSSLHAVHPQKTQMRD
jgi:hypothetical protein